MSLNRKWVWVLFITVAFVWMAAYPIYTNYSRGKAVLQHKRHHEFLSGNSIFFNPWQYRVLSPLLVEGVYYIFDNTIYRFIDFENLVNVNVIQGPEDSLMSEEEKATNASRKIEIIKYNIVFAVFRFFQNLIILILSFTYFSLFVQNRAFVLFSTLFVSLIMGNAVVDSDLSFNVYMDIIFFLLAAIVIVKPLSDWWIVPITVLGAFNRETSALIPAMYFFSKIKLDSVESIKRSILSVKPFLVSCLATACFVLIFFGIRMYYGYRSPDEWHIPTGWPMLKMNLFSPASVKSYMELFAVFGLMPILLLIIFQRINSFLRTFFLVIVPVWFFVNFWFGIVSESRIFLVPTLIVFLPATLEFIESFNKKSKLTV